MLDQNYWANASSRWFRSSPQHICFDDLLTCFEPDFFDYSFAVVRDPVDRLLSAYNHNRMRIGRRTSFQSFLTKLERRTASEGDFFGEIFDNHFVPAARIVPPKSRIFYLSEGMDEILRVISTDLGISINPVPAQNKKEYDQVLGADSALKRRAKGLLFTASPKRGDLRTATVESIRALYREDYERFFASE